MTPRSLKDELRQYYDTIPARPELVERLVTRADSPLRASAWHRPILAAVLATVVIVLIFAVPERDHSLPLAERTAREIALNHNKSLDLEFPFGNFERLRQAMIKLDFPLQAPQRLRNAGFTVLGGRYCSIQGQIAAQIRLRRDDGSIHTLYQTRLTPLLAGLTGATLSYDGVRVVSWSEQQQFFALASSVRDRGVFP